MGRCNQRGAIYIVVDLQNRGDYFDDVSKAKNYYLDQAVFSASSLKKHMPELPVTLFTNINIETAQPFDNIMRITTQVTDVWVTKFDCLLNSPYEQTLHMDADTFVCDKVDEVFSSLDRFDIAATMSVSWNTRPFQSAPNCFPELAFGVFWFRRNDEVDKFFRKTRDYLKRRQGGCDEPWVRLALYESKVRFYVLPWEYNCLYVHPAYLFDKVKIMHGHSKTIEEDTEIINTKIYEDYPPWKRLITGTKVLLFKKVRQKIMKVEKEIEYKGLGNDLSRA